MIKLQVLVIPESVYTEKLTDSDENSHIGGTNDAANLSAIAPSTNNVFRYSTPENAMNNSILYARPGSFNPNASYMFPPSFFPSHYVQQPATNKIKKFLHITSASNNLETVAHEIASRYQKLYPKEDPLNILKIQNSEECDLDPDYVVSMVFDTSNICRVIVSNEFNDEINSIGKRLSNQDLNKVMKKRRSTTGSANTSIWNSPVPESTNHNSTRSNHRTKHLNKPLGMIDTEPDVSAAIPDPEDTVIHPSKNRNFKLASPIIARGSPTRITSGMLNIQSQPDLSKVDYEEDTNGSIYIEQDPKRASVPSKEDRDQDEKHTSTPFLARLNNPDSSMIHESDISSSSIKSPTAKRSAAKITNSSPINVVIPDNNVQGVASKKQKLNKDSITDSPTDNKKSKILIEKKTKAKTEEEKQKEKEEKERAKAEKAALKAKEKAEKAEKLAKEKAERAERLAKEKAEKAERLAKEKAEKAERLAREKAEKAAKTSTEKTDKPDNTAKPNKEKATKSGKAIKEKAVDEKAEKETAEKKQPASETVEAERTNGLSLENVKSNEKVDKEKLEKTKSVSDKATKSKAAKDKTVEPALKNDSGKEKLPKDKTEQPIKESTAKEKSAKDKEEKEKAEKAERERNKAIADDETAAQRAKDHAAKMAKEIAERLLNAQKKITQETPNESGKKTSDATKKPLKAAKTDTKEAKQVESDVENDEDLKVIEQLTREDTAEDEKLRNLAKPTKVKKLTVVQSQKPTEIDTKSSISKAAVVSQVSQKKNSKADNKAARAVEISGEIDKSNILPPKPRGSKIIKEILSSSDSDSEVDSDDSSDDTSDDEEKSKPKVVTAPSNAKPRSVSQNNASATKVTSNVAPPKDVVSTPSQNSSSIRSEINEPLSKRSTLPRLSAFIDTKLPEVRMQKQSKKAPEEKEATESEIDTDSDSDSDTDTDSDSNSDSDNDRSSKFINSKTASQFVSSKKPKGKKNSGFSALMKDFKK
ncbi:hypothetical protein CANINC_000503 [Pichia inconspicua]|uniref:Nucleolar protein Dnt1-like N-terminal domain-containing protein n=1 Tax=Pichia inconspicua TaxID=52247 RepID=A0A4T0X5Z8_9ASCO|nr:hypothetical protein CANINC_000503 [[Candida] inconspicua]